MFGRIEVRTTCLCVVLAFALSAAARGQVWRGTAPFCNGQCLPGETQVATSKTGDGGTCWTGHKVKCQKLGGPKPCMGTQTKVSCFAVVEICDNGYYELPSNAWHSCNKYACGGCVGFSAVALSTNGVEQASIDLTSSKIVLPESGAAERYSSVSATRPIDPSLTARSGIHALPSQAANCDVQTPLPTTKKVKGR